MWSSENAEAVSGREPYPTQARTWILSIQCRLPIEPASHWQRASGQGVWSGIFDFVDAAADPTPTFGTLHTAPRESESRKKKRSQNAVQAAYKLDAERSRGNARAKSPCCACKPPRGVGRKSTS